MKSETMSNDLDLSIGDAAKLLGLSTTVLHEFALRGDIPYTRSAMGWRFSRRDIEIAAAWIERNDSQNDSQDGSPYRDSPTPPAAA